MKPLDSPQELSIKRFRKGGWCSVEGCGLRQYRSPSGWVCENGHGSAPTLPAEPMVSENSAAL